MSLDGRLFQQRFKSLFSSTVKPTYENGIWFYPIDMFEKDKSLLTYFLEVPEVNAILNIRARAMASWKLSVVSKKTGKEFPQNQSLIRILRSPNWFQSQSEYWKQSSLFRDIYGNEYIYFLHPVGMPNSFKGLFTLDPSNVKIEYTSKDPFFFQSDNSNIRYSYIIKDKKIPLEITDVVHLNDNRVVTKDFLKGTSKLKSLEPAIKNIIAAYEKRNISLRMPIGILSNGQGDGIGQAVPMNPDEKKDVQKKLKTRGAYPIITNLNVNYSDMKVNAKNMGLFDETRADTEKICDTYGVPYELLASEKGVTFANLKEAKKQFYEETIIPDAQEKVFALNMHLGTENKAWEIKADFSHLPIFQEDLSARATTLNSLTVALNNALEVEAITIDQYKKELAKFGI